MGGLKKKNIVITFLLCLLACLVWIPLLLMVTNSFTGVDEIGERFGAVLSGTEGTVKFLFLPRFPTLKPYIELLFDSPGFFVIFGIRADRYFLLYWDNCWWEFLRHGLLADINSRERRYFLPYILF